MAGISKDPAKITVELEKVNEQIRVLTEKKKDLEERLQSVYDAEVAGIFKRKTIGTKEFCIAFKGLSDEKMRMVLEYAKKIDKANNTDNMAENNNPDVKERVTE